MKIIYSLLEFRNELLKLAAMKDETYAIVRATIDYDGHIEFDAYINGFNWENGTTMDECLQKVRDKMFPQVQKFINTDVEIEIEIPETGEQL